MEDYPLDKSVGADGEPPKGAADRRPPRSSPLRPISNDLPQIP